MSDREAVRFLARHIVEQTESGNVHLEWSQLRERAAASGLQLSEEQLAEASSEIVNALVRAGELSDDELETVAGGTTNRTMASTAFQNFEQRSNQAFNMLSSVLRTMDDVRLGTIRSML